MPHQTHHTWSYVVLGFIDIIAENLLIAGAVIVLALAAAWDQVRLFLLRLLGGSGNQPTKPDQPSQSVWVPPIEPEPLYDPIATVKQAPKTEYPACSDTATNQLLSGLQDKEPSYLSDNAAFDLAIESLAYAVDYFKAIGNEEGERLARQAAQSAFDQQGEDKVAPTTKGAKK